MEEFTLIELTAGPDAFHQNGPLAELAANAWLHHHLTHEGPKRPAILAHFRLNGGSELSVLLTPSAATTGISLRRLVALQTLREIHRANRTLTARHASHNLLGQLLGPGIKAVTRKQALQARRTTLAACPCGRRVPWVNAYLGNRIVHALSLHAPQGTPGTVCPESRILYACLDRRLPTNLGCILSVDPPPELGEESYWLRLALAVLPHLGGPINHIEGAGTLEPLHAPVAPPEKPKGVRDRTAPKRVESNHGRSGPVSPSRRTLRGKPAAEAS